MKNVKISNVISVVMGALFIASLLWTIGSQRTKSSLEANLEKEKLRSESLLSEKLLRDKEVERLKDQLSEVEKSNVRLDKLVSVSAAKLKSQEVEFNRMKHDNISLAQIRKQRQELILLEKELQSELQALKGSHRRIELQNAELSSTVASLQEKNKSLLENLDRALASAIDQSQIQSVKGKSDKLTLRARRTKKLIADFMVPASLTNLSFRIIDSKGNMLTPTDGTIAFKVSEPVGSLTASTRSNVKGNKIQKVEMSYLTKKKLQPGVYTVEILNENLYVSGLKIKLI